jgi:AcrR family transcriptional regulator
MTSETHEPASSATRARYHHGNLRAALVEAAVDLARTGGPEAVVVRAASRRVGVSHNAAYRHFPDRDALLKAVCGRCMTELAWLLEQGIASVDLDDHTLEAERQRLRAIGAAYVQFALSEPGWFRTAFAVPPGMGYLEPGAGEGDSGRGPFDLLNAQLDALVAAGGLAAERRAGAEITAWSAVHGLATLLIDGPLRELPGPDRQAAVDRVVGDVERGLTVSR